MSLLRSFTTGSSNSWGSFDYEDEDEGRRTSTKEEVLKIDTSDDFGLRIADWEGRHLTLASFVIKPPQIEPTPPLAPRENGKNGKTHLLL